LNRRRLLASGAAGLKAVRLPRSSPCPAFCLYGGRLQSTEEKRPRRAFLPRSTAEGTRVWFVSQSLRHREAITNTQVRAIGQQSRPIVLLGRHVVHSRRRPVRVSWWPADDRLVGCGPRSPSDASFCRGAHCLLPSSPSVARRWSRAPGAPARASRRPGTARGDQASGRE
jgi:hypothetical protein